jgi:uncharacterized protein
MAVASFRFYANLNDFLPPAAKSHQLSRYFIKGATAKHLIESFGVPHPEVDLILVNGEPATFSSPLHDGDQVSVYPLFRSLDVSPPGVRPTFPLPPRFVLDVHLGRLAAGLRMLGFDAVYSNSASDPELAAMVDGRPCVLLTRDRYLLMRSEVVWGYWVRSAEPRRQLAEVVSRWKLMERIQPFTRCMECNGELQPVSKESVLERLPPKVRQFDEFSQCSRCGRIYWKGTHWQKMTKVIESLQASGWTNALLRNFDFPNPPE